MTPRWPTPEHRQEWLEVERRQRAETLRVRLFQARAHFARTLHALREAGRRVAVLREPEVAPGSQRILARIQVDDEIQRWRYADGAWEVETP